VYVDMTKAGGILFPGFLLPQDTVMSYELRVMSCGGRSKTLPLIRMESGKSFSLSLRGSSAEGLRQKSPAEQRGESPRFLLRRNLSKSGWRYIAPCAWGADVPFCRLLRWIFLRIAASFCWKILRIFAAKASSQ